MSTQTEPWYVAENKTWPGARANLTIATKGAAFHETMSFDETTAKELAELLEKVTGSPWFASPEKW